MSIEESISVWFEFLLILSLIIGQNGAYLDSWVTEITVNKNEKLKKNKINK